jgi:hypothetical protein
MLPFMEHCLAETVARPEAERVELADYAMVADQNFPLGLGDWIFAVPPFRDATDRDAQYRHADGRDPETYVGSLRQAIEASFGEREARLFLACEDGATAAEARGALGEAETTDLAVDDVQEFLDERVCSRLMYEEGDRYLALALPANRPEHV